MGKEHIKDPGVLTPFPMKWYHGVLTRYGCHRVMPLYGTMESVPRSGASKCCGFDWWIIMIILFVPGLLFYFTFYNFIFCDSLTSIIYLEILKLL